MIATDACIWQTVGNWSVRSSAVQSYIRFIDAFIELIRSVQHSADNNLIFSPRLENVAEFMGVNKSTELSELVYGSKARDHGICTSWLTVMGQSVIEIGLKSESELRLRWMLASFKFTRGNHLRHQLLNAAITRSMMRPSQPMGCGMGNGDFGNFITTLQTPRFQTPTLAATQ